jgi:hypothetical protein
MKDPLDLDATILGPVVELRYETHGEAVRQLRILRERLAQRDELLNALIALHTVAWVEVDKEYAAVTNAAAVIERVTGERS